MAAQRKLANFEKIKVMFYRLLLFFVNSHKNLCVQLELIRGFTTELLYSSSLLLKHAYKSLMAFTTNA